MTPPVLRPIAEEVLVAEEPAVALGADDIEDLKRRALANARRRIRICAHADNAADVHEMLIVHTAGAYVPPHRHLGKSESAHVVEGEAEAVFFDDDGTVREVVALGPPSSGRRFFYRLDEPTFHTLLITSEFFVFHEVTKGPFCRDDTEFAPWAPDEGDDAAAAEFQAELARRIAS